MRQRHAFSLTSGLRRRTCGLAIGAALLGALVSPSGSAQQATVFRTDVNLVQIEAVVLDENGAPVRGLSVADFELIDRGFRQTIIGFSEVVHRPESSAASALSLPPTLIRDVVSNASTRTDRKVVLVIDDLHLYRGRTETARHLARRIVRELGPSVSMAVLFTSGEHSTQIVEDRGLLLAAVERTDGRKARPASRFADARPNQG
jgi:VWFA-related protein